jgi:cell shape-determining protein MreD
MDSQVEVPRGRLWIAGAVVVTLQMALVSQVPPFSGSADLVPLAGMAIGLLFGSLPGAIFGFAIGLAMDFLLVQTLGEYALLDLVVGYGAGRLMELRPMTGRLYLVPAGAAASAVSTIGYGLLQVLFGGGANLSGTVIQQAALAIMWGAVLSIPVYVLVRRITRVTRSRDGGGSTRRRAYATGGLSPLTPGKRR